MLAKQIQFKHPKATFKATKEFGDNYDLYLSIIGPNGKTIDGIKTVWQKDKDSDFFRLITILPPRKR